LFFKTSRPKKEYEGVDGPLSCKLHGSGTAVLIQSLQALSPHPQHLHRLLCLSIFLALNFPLRSLFSGLLKWESTTVHHLNVKSSSLALWIKWPDYVRQSTIIFQQFLLFE